MKTKKRTRIVRGMLGEKVEYRGKNRQVVVLLDITAGTITVRLEGCSKRKTYQAADLFTWKPATPQLSLPLSFEQ